MSEEWLDRPYRGDEYWDVGGTAEDYGIDPETGLSTYEPEFDKSIVDPDDTRKTKLTLSQINRARKGAESHKKEKSKELDITRQMYGLAAQAAAAGV